ncbi:TAXI family TRAP transporter solute-binding subunit [Alkalihalobacillus sp. TS-13]|uniref:TAXI family TRAP transporter solute-binding subunit n=1 Tax=Alkalihalobacillus sp. TS-13 TaxID=2842455 RepID=UPI001C876092|nr:TAXI family TRAP transporter solute-binding subunit [Alkalihalobacillus sp. TS-13]
MKKLYRVFLIVALIVLSACTAPQNNTTSGDENNKGNGAEDANGKTSQSQTVNQPTNLTWAAGSLGGGWYSMAGGIGSMIKQNNSNLNIKVIPGGSLQNIPFLENGQAQIAWEQPAFVMAAVNGEDPFKKKYPDIVALGNGFGVNYFHFAVGEDTNIDSIDEIFENKMPIKIAVTPVNNSDEWVFKKFLSYYGVSYEDIESWGGKIFHGSYTEQAEQFKNGNVDAMFTQLAIPGSAITDASNGRNMKILTMSNELIDHLSEFAIGKGEIPAGTYPEAVNGDEAIQTAVMGNILVTNKNASEDVIYEITKIVNENKEKLPNIHASLEAYSTEQAIKDLGTTLHPGAEKYYKEIGVIK